jgi:hypothetical protein
MPDLPTPLRRGLLLGGSGLCLLAAWLPVQHALLAPDFRAPVPAWALACPGTTAAILAALLWTWVLLLCAAAARLWITAVPGEPRSTSLPRLLLAGFGAALLAVGPALRSDFHFDDLFLLRPYSWAELIGAWTGPWDASGVLRSAYRPLTTLGAAAAHALFGENPVAYRLGNALLFTAGWIWVLRELLGAETLRRSGLALIALWFSCSALSIYAGWITEGYRGLQLVTFAASLAALRRALPTLSMGWVAVSLAAFLACLLAREEAAPLALWLAGRTWAEGTRLPNGNPRRRALPVAALFLLCPVVLLLLRQVFLSPSDAFDFTGPFRLLGRILYALPLGGLLLLPFLVVGWRQGRPERTLLRLRLAQAFLALLPGVAMVRLDVGLFPLLFLLAACAPGVLALAVSRRGRLALTALLLAGGVVGLPTHWMRMQDLQPHSLNDIRRNNQVLHGFLSAQIEHEIPAGRRERFERRYADLGIRPGPDFRADLEAALETARREQRFRPDASGKPFRHAWDFLSSTPGLHPALRVRVGRLLETP